MNGHEPDVPWEARVYEAEEWPHGLRCDACGGGFLEGQPVSQKLDSFIDETPVVVIVCVGCAMTGVGL